MESGYYALNTKTFSLFFGLHDPQKSLVKLRVRIRDLFRVPQNKALPLSAF